MGKQSYEEAVIIKKDKVYSSYYTRACRIIPDYKLVSISIGIPEWFNGDICRELNPSSSLLYKYKNNMITDEEYTVVYTNEVLSKLDPYEMYNKLKGKVIVCHCGQNKFCHRTLVMKWLKDNLGEEAVGNEI